VEDTSRYEKSAVWLAWLGCDGRVSVLLYAGSGLVPVVSGMVNIRAMTLPEVALSHNGLPQLLSSRFFLSSTLPLPWNTKLSHCFLSLHAIIMSEHRVQHTPITAYTEYSIYWVMHHLKIDCLLHPGNLSSLGTPC
jgi:hypothetical protein